MTSNRHASDGPLEAALPVSKQAAEEILIRRLQARDAGAMDELYDAYGRITYSVILRMVRDPGIAEDVTQETFLRVWTAIRSFDPSRGGLGTWIVAVARNRAIDYLRSSNCRVGRQSVELDGAVERSLKIETPDNVERIDNGRKVNRAMSVLSRTQRLVLNLAFNEGLSHSEIAARIEKPLGTVKTWIRSALIMMRAQIEST